MPLWKSDVLKQLSREQLSRVIFAIRAEDCGSPAGANRKAVLKCASCSLDTRQEAEYCEAAAFNGRDHTEAKMSLTVRLTRATELQRRLLSYAPQQQEENVSEHKHVCLCLRSQTGSWKRKDGKCGGRILHTVSSHEASATHQNNVAKLIPKSLFGGTRVSSPLGPRGRQVFFGWKTILQIWITCSCEQSSMLETVFRAFSKMRGV